MVSWPEKDAWEGLYPPVPSTFEWEPFTAFVPMIAIVMTFVVAFVVVFGRGRSLLDKFLLGYFVVSVIIHFNLERYYTHHLGEILDPSNNHLMARVWRHYGVSDTRWHGLPPPGIENHGEIPVSQYSCMFGLEWLAAYACGPLVLLTIILYIIKSPMRFAVQPCAVSFQAYGLFITWLPAFFENHQSVSKNSALFYGYYIGWQFPWAIIPLICIVQSCLRIREAFSIAEKVKKESHGKKE